MPLIRLDRIPLSTSPTLPPPLPSLPLNLFQLQTTSAQERRLLALAMLLLRSSCGDEGRWQQSKDSSSEDVFFKDWKDSITYRPLSKESTKFANYTLTKCSLSIKQRTIRQRPNYMEFGGLSITRSIADGISKWPCFIKIQLYRL